MMERSSRADEYQFEDEGNPLRWIERMRDFAAGCDHLPCYVQTEVSTGGQFVVPFSFGVDTESARAISPTYCREGIALSGTSDCLRVSAKMRQIGIIGATKDVGSDHFQALALGIGHFPDPVMLRIWLTLTRTRKWGK